MNISRVRHYRKQKGLSQKELAELCGLSAPSPALPETNSAAASPAITASSET